MDDFRITTAPLEEAAIMGEAADVRDGAVVAFSGVVRGRNLGREVLHLEYEAYEAMVVPVFERIAEAARSRFGVTTVRIHHRIGRVEVGEASVVVVVASGHRRAAFDAAKHVMDEVKRIAPIWKREFFEGGDIWVEGPKEPVTE